MGAEDNSILDDIETDYLDTADLGEQAENLVSEPDLNEDMAPSPAADDILADAALDDDVLAALMADDEVEPVSGEVIAAADSYGLSDDADEAIHNDSQPDDIPEEASEDIPLKSNPVPAAEVPIVVPTPHAELVAAEQEMQQQKPVPSVNYDEFGSAPDLSDLNAQATDTDAAFHQQRFVDVDGIDEARPLNASSVDAKLKDLQARGLAESDISRAKSSEELT